MFVLLFILLILIIVNLLLLLLLLQVGFRSAQLSSILSRKVLQSAVASGTSQTVSMELYQSHLSRVCLAGAV
jgi:hypothetical protein